MKKRNVEPTLTERVTRAVGSIPSLILHTLFFASAFVSVILGILDFNTMLLILTTIVSLEAIYLAIFIQMTVNANTLSLREVEEDIDEIQEDVEELGEDMDEIQEDLEEIGEDIEELGEELEEIHEEDAEEEKREKQQAINLEQLTSSVRQILEDLEGMKKKK